ncbi:MAG: MBL fold metallo-hydrolase [Gammaproteobacteria bacterium]|nr:MBL fold metallo-hydrolase [Gammaproteobacteria bacterium]
MPDESPRLSEHGDGITAIDTGLLRPFFDASHLVVDSGRGAFVDCGVNDSVPLLLAALAQKDLDPGDVDFLFLTHVHLDHAGGAGLLMRALPNAMAVLHPRGAPHMIDPSKLEKGAIAVYGEAEYRAMYGDVVAIPEERVIVAEDRQLFAVGGRALTSVYTEGHARHHHCFHDDLSHSVFTGDSFGLSYRELDTEQGEFIYPTTTPVHFDPPEAHRAIETILSFGPKQLFLTHYSKVADIDRLAVDLHRRIDDFVAIAERHAGDDERTANIHADMYEYFEAELAVHGFTGGAGMVREIVGKDVILNTMGLEFWLDHR